MDTTHYWPFAREYSKWNATFTALQFWMADLKPHTLSNATGWVHTAFFYSNSAQQLRNISEEVLFDHFMTTINDTFERELTLEMKVMRVGVEAYIFPLLYVEHHACVTSQQVTTCLLILPHHLHIEHTHLKDTAASAPYATAFCLVMMKHLQQIAAHFMVEQNNLHPRGII